MPSDQEKEMRTALEAVREAARVCQGIQGQITTEVLEKKDRSPVTMADFGSQALICRRLGQAFPSDPVISEEDSSGLQSGENAELWDRVVDEVGRVVPDADRTAVCSWIDHGKTSHYCERFWTLDPIDGTKGFLRGEQYAISLALIVNGRVQLGVLACPNLAVDPSSPQSTGAVFAAVRGQGASVCGLPADAASRPLHVSSTSQMSAARFCESVEAADSSHGDAEQIAARLSISAAPVRLDSQAKYAVVARGEADIYMRLPTRADYREKIWDHAAGVIVLNEAGGRVTDASGAEIEFTHGSTLASNRGILATNGRLHEGLLDCVRSVTGL